MNENVRTDGNSEVEAAVREEYAVLELEVIELEEDVITSSGCTCPGELPEVISPQ